MTTHDTSEIRDVSDTALWVAWYRVKESDRPDALFRDPLAKVLVGERGERIARGFGRISRYTEWTVITRTVNIDEMILEGIRDGVDAVVNLGAGLDTRPWRLDLPTDFPWIEADFPHMVEYKRGKLAGQAPRCRLESVGVDLSDDAARRAFLAGAAPGAKKVLVLTEGVVPYLTEAQVTNLADDLRAQPRFAFWITEYFSPLTYPFLKATARSSRMKNAPFRFYPRDWLGFFAARGWTKRDIRHASAIARRFGRVPPMPWWARLLMRFAPPARQEEMRTSSGYMLLAPDSP